jgi:hypothetical protein
MHSRFLVKASLLSRAFYRQWKGPTVPSASFRPFAISDVVPDAQFWVILALSAYQTFPDTAACWGFSLIPTFRTTPYDPQSILAPDFLSPTVVQANAPPVRVRSYQMSLGGTQPAPEVIFNNGSSNSVNLLGAKKFYLRPGWMLMGLHDINGGGGSGFLVLNAMILALGTECEAVEVGAQKAPRINWGESVSYHV